ncbi:MAG: hypothetical protein JEZ04_00750 [Spirochaetales bacterium]|nr:hypothetical protein [Spirochaetales bacterium]
MKNEDESISKLILPMLKGRINLVDMQFLFHHFFGNEKILPPDLTFDLTIRSFFSFKAAIAKALIIEETPSTASPENTALYLLVLLSRMDLNEQNKVMIALLLSRIDANLPEEVNEGIYAYLKNMIELIKEVAEKGDKILAESLNLEDEPVISYTARNYPKTTDASLEKDDIKNIRISDSMELKKNYLKKNDRRQVDSQADQQTVNPEGQHVPETSLKRETSKTEPEQNSSKEATLFPRPDLPEKIGHILSRQTTKEPVSESSALENETLSSDSRNPLGNQLQKLQKKKEGERSDDTEQAVTEHLSEKMKNEQFKIKFNRFPSFIEELLITINEDDNKPDIIENKLPLSSPEPDSQENFKPLPVHVNKTRKKINRKLFIVPAAILGLLILILVVLLKDTEEESGATPALSTEELAQTIRITNDTSATGTTQSPDYQDRLSPELLEWDLNPAGNDGWIWTVKEGQSFWKLYIHFYREKTLWHDLLSEIKKMNPDLKNIKRLEPGEQYQVPPPPE